MAGEFTLHIRLGNAEMRTPEHIARELHAVADQLADDPQKDGTIIEVNGNSVGSFHMELPEPPHHPVKASELEAGMRVKVDDNPTDADWEYVRLEIDAEPMPGGRVELITEPHSEGFLFDAAQELDVLDEEAV